MTDHKLLKILSNIRLRRHVHRIQFTVDGVDIKTVKPFLEKNGLSKEAIERTKNGFAYKFRYKRALITFMSYNKSYGRKRLSINLINASKASQIAIKKILRELRSKSIYINYNISEVEFTFDFYPSKKCTLEEVEECLSGCILKKYSRAGFINQCTSTSGTTIYQGRNGNIREGRNGCRSYHKGQRSFYRHELQLNRKSVRKEKISVDTLPINHKSIDIDDYLFF